MCALDSRAQSISKSASITKLPPETEALWPANQPLVFKLQLMKFAMISAYMTEKEAHYHSNVSFNRGSLLPSKFFDKSINKVVLSFQSHDKVMASIVATSNSTAKHNLNNLHHECSHTSHVRLLVRKLSMHSGQAFAC